MVKRKEIRTERNERQRPKEKVEPQKSLQKERNAPSMLVPFPTALMARVYELHLLSVEISLMPELSTLGKNHPRVKVLAM